MSVEVFVRRGISWDELETLRAQCTQLAIAHEDRQFLILSEPQATYTSGKRATPEELLRPPTDTAACAFRKVSRGGRWTYHGPGQILIYPIFRLRALGLPSRGVRPFLDRLGRALSDWLSSYGVSATLGEPFGLYVDQKKLGAFGLSLERGVISHGVALYVAPQNDAFRYIHPCGVPGQLTTSLFESGVRLSWEDVSAQIVETLKKSFLPETDWAYNVPKHDA